VPEWAYVTLGVVAVLGVVLGIGYYTERKANRVWLKAHESDDTHQWGV